MLLSIQQAFVVLFALVVTIQCQTLRPEDSSKFMGYYIAPGSIQALTASYSWVTSGSYAYDCSTTGRCPIPTKCANNVLTFDDDTVATCGEGASCVAVSVYSSSPFVTPSASHYGCYINWSAYTIYRELPAITTVSSTITSVPPLPSFVSTPTPTSTLVPAPPPSNTNPVTPGRKSNVWIAGAVIGPVAGIALIAAAIYWWRRRSGKAHEAVDMNPQGRGHSEVYAPVQQYHNKDSHGQGVELPMAQPPIELSTNNLR